ncbi:MAG: M56 family metallopeptidase, partial [Planctomycetota bacterium]
MDWIRIWDMAPPYGSLVILAAKASLVLGLALAANVLLRRLAASTRFFLISAPIFLAAAMPVLVSLAPDWEMPVPVVIQSHMTTPAASEPGQTPVSGSTTLVAEPDITLSGVTTPSESPAPFQRYIIYIWLIGTAVVAARVALGLAYSVRVRRNTSRVTGGEINRLRKLAVAASRRLKLGRHVTVYLSERAITPQTLGIFKPAVILPTTAGQWPDAQVTAVLLHELAHVKRRDHITWPLANLAICWLWFNPLVWMALSAMRFESEKACDDLVLGCGITRVSFAQHLLSICTSLRSSVRLTPAGAA